VRQFYTPQQISDILSAIVTLDMINPGLYGSNANIGTYFPPPSAATSQSLSNLQPAF